MGRSVIPSREDFGFGLQGGRALMRQIGDMLVAEWAATARTQGRMTSTLSAYIQSINIRAVEEKSVSVELPGRNAGPKAAMLARMLEFGMGPGGIGTSGSYQMRKYLLTGAKAKRGKQGLPAHRQGDRMGGPIMNVKFRHGSAGASHTTPRSRMSSSVNQAARRLEASTTSGNRTVYGGRLSRPGARRGRNPTTGARHANNRHEGMVRMTDSRGQTSGYRSWRRASLSQDSGKWVHPGIKARRLTEIVERKIPQIVETAIQTMLGGQ